MYLAQLLNYYIGFYRMLPIQEFQFEVGLGYAFDLIVSVFPMFMIQVVNNGDSSSLSVIQSLTMLIKCLCLILLVVEIVLYIWEVITLKNMRELKFKGFEAPTEEDRRKRHSQRVFRTSVLFFGLFILGLIIAVGLLNGRVC